MHPRGQERARPGARGVRTGSGHTRGQDRRGGTRGAHAGRRNSQAREPVCAQSASEATHAARGRGSGQAGSSPVCGSFPM